VTLRELWNHGAGLPTFVSPSLSETVHILGLRGSVTEERRVFTKTAPGRSPLSCWKWSEESKCWTFRTGRGQLSFSH
jgi:hypothetical protein